MILIFDTFSEGGNLHVAPHLEAELGARCLDVPREHADTISCLCPVCRCAAPRVRALYI